MLEQEQLGKIQLLARKSRLEGLTQTEKEEQDRLRTLYLQQFKAWFIQVMGMRDTDTDMPAALRRAKRG